MKKWFFLLCFFLVLSSSASAKAQRKDIIGTIAPIYIPPSASLEIEDISAKEPEVLISTQKKPLSFQTSHQLNSKKSARFLSNLKDQDLILHTVVEKMEGSEIVTFVVF